MPITTPNFTATQSISSNNLITFTDTSVGSDVGLTSRRIYCRLANGNWLTTGGVESTTEAYTAWAIGDTSTTIDLLVQSTVSNVRVDWMTGSAATYTKTILTIWDLYDYVFLFSQLSTQTSSPARTDTQGYWPNSFQMVTNLFQAESAVTYMDDLYSSAGALARNLNFINNENIYF